MNSPSLDLWNQSFEFTVANERIATYQRDMQRLMLVQKREKARYQLIAFEV